MFVDLDFIKKNILQRIQRRIPRSEIVHGNADIPVVEEADHLVDGINVMDIRRLRDLEDQILRRNLIMIEQLCDPLCERIDFAEMNR